VNPKDPSEGYAVSEKPVCGLEGTDGMIPAHVDSEELIWVSVFHRLKAMPFHMSIGRLDRLPGRHPMLDEIAPRCRLINGGITFASFGWFASGNNFLWVADKLHPVYEIYTTQAEHPVIQCEGHEYRIGKPHAWHDDQEKCFRMLCTAYSRPDNRANLVFLSSKDGYKWGRLPFEITGDVFPSPIYAYRCGGWVFFNGAGNGVGGIGYGRLED